MTLWTEILFSHLPFGLCSSLKLSFLLKISRHSAAPFPKASCTLFHNLWHTRARGEVGILFALVYNVEFWTRKNEVQILSWVLNSWGKWMTHKMSASHFPCWCDDSVWLMFVGNSSSKSIFHDAVMEWYYHSSTTCLLLILLHLVHIIIVVIYSYQYWSKSSSSPVSTLPGSQSSLTYPTPFKHSKLPGFQLCQHLLKMLPSQFLSTMNKNIKLLTPCTPSFPVPLNWIWTCNSWSQLYQTLKSVSWVVINLFS